MLAADEDGKLDHADLEPGDRVFGTEFVDVTIEDKDGEVSWRARPSVILRRGEELYYAHLDLDYTQVEDEEDEDAGAVAWLFELYDEARGRPRPLYATAEQAVLAYIRDNRERIQETLARYRRVEHQLAVARKRPNPEVN